MKMKDISLTDLSIIVSIILIPSWTTAYFTDKVVYVIPMLAVTTFIVAQVMQHRNNRRLDKDEFNEFKKDEGMKDDGSVHE
tara:strand:- start:403 stop:645 length:243 start_codon:yes stop_codon:yes gene_type:complete